MTPDDLHLLTNLSLRDTPGYVVSAYRELLAEIQRLTDELDARESSSGLAATREIDLRADRDAAIDSLRTIRRWATSRLEILHHPQHLPHSSTHAAQVAVLNDLASVLDVLAAEPQPTDGGK